MRGTREGMGGEAGPGEEAASRVGAGKALPCPGPRAPGPPRGPAARKPWRIGRRARGRVFRVRIGAPGQQDGTHGGMRKYYILARTGGGASGHFGQQAALPFPDEVICCSTKAVAATEPQCGAAGGPASIHPRGLLPGLGWGWGRAGQDEAGPPIPSGLLSSSPAGGLGPRPSDNGLPSRCGELPPCSCAGCTM